MTYNNESHPLPPDELGLPPVEPGLFAAPGNSPTTAPPTTVPPNQELTN
jgi:hypothetical protein